MALRGRARAVVDAALLTLVIASWSTTSPARHYVRGDWTRAQLYALSDKTVSVLQHLPKPVEAYVFLYPGRDNERARALAGMVRELCDRFSRFAPDKFHAEFIDPDRNPARAETMQKKYGVGAFEMGEGVVIFAAGTQSKFLTRDDLVDYDLEAEMNGQPGGHLRAWKGEPAFVSALLAVTERASADDLLYPGTRRARHRVVRRRRLRHVRRGDPARRLPDAGDRASAARGAARGVHRAGHRRAATGVHRRRRWRRSTGGLDAGGRVLIMLGPVFNHDASGFAHVGLEAFARRWGIDIGDNLVVDPAHASDIEGPSVWMTSDYSGTGGPAGSPGLGAVLGRLAGRATIWPRARAVHVRPPAAPALAAPGTTAPPTPRGRDLVHNSDAGWAETDLATIRGEADLVFDAGRDIKGPVSVAAAVVVPSAAPAGESRASSEGRLVVLGTGRLIMNYRLAGALVRDYDRDFMLSVLAWLADRQERSGVAPKIPDQLRLALEEGTVTHAFQLFVIGLPAACLVLAALVWYRRRV